MSTAGDAAALVALLLRLRPEGSGWVAALLAGELIPVILLAPVAGRVVDRFDSHRVLLIALIGQGLSNAEIGGQLHLSEATVKGYVSAVLSKIGAANRVQAALLAYRGGLLDQ